jgi:histidine triad (HIT) family protein
MPSIFSKIISREIPAYIVAEDSGHIAFLDINPLVMGHCLVVPKVEIDYIYDLSDSQLANLNIFAKNVARAIEGSVDCKRIGIAVIGLEVPHVHIHLVPLNSMDDINFSRTKLTPAQDELVRIAEAIRNNFP